MSNIIAVVILNLDIRWRWVVTFKPRRLCSPLPFE